MKKSTLNPKTHRPVQYNVKEPLLFTIPNPFDDYYPKKQGWYVEVKKMEESIKSVRERLDELTQLQKQRKIWTTAINEYCHALRKKQFKSHN